MEKREIVLILYLAAIAVVMIQACTSNLFVVRGQRNAIKTEQNISTDSTSVSVNNQK